jgi:hypothetical protein
VGGTFRFITSAITYAEPIFSAVSFKQMESNN